MRRSLPLILGGWVVVYLVSSAFFSTMIALELNPAPESPTFAPPAARPWLLFARIFLVLGGLFLLILGFAWLRYRFINPWLRRPKDAA